MVTFVADEPVPVPAIALVEAYPLEFVRFEPYVIPKKSLTGDTTERVDTRVLQVVYRVKDPNAPLYVGQQMDVYIETPVPSTAFRRHSGSAAGGAQ